MAAATAVRAILIAASCWVSACVSTNTDPIGVRAQCGPARPRRPEDAIVRVDAELAPGRIICSGVAIAKTLVVTALGCVSRPSRWPDPNPGSDPLFGNPAPLETVDGTSTFADACRRDGTWDALEDGSLSGRYGKAIDATALSVFRLDGDSIRPVSVVTSRAASRCSDGVALLVFDRELDVMPLPVRLDDDSALDEAASLIGYCRADPDPLLEALSSSVQAETRAAGTDQLPPRSLLLSQGTSALEVGGAVTSSTTSALLGIMMSGTARTCAGRDPGGTTIAVRLAPFRRMLLETAADEQVELELERLVEPVSAERVDCQ